MAKFILKTWDGDMYVLSGYESQKQIDEIISSVEGKLEMPNGDMIHPSDVSKIQSVASYRFQAKQKSRHKKGQYIRKGGWQESMGGFVEPVKELESITGAMSHKQLPGDAQGKSLKAGS